MSETDMESGSGEDQSRGESSAPSKGETKPARRRGGDRRQASPERTESSSGSERPPPEPRGETPPGRHGGERGSASSGPERSSPGGGGRHRQGGRPGFDDRGGQRPFDSRGGGRKKRGKRRGGRPGGGGSQGGRFRVDGLSIDFDSHLDVGTLPELREGEQVESLVAFAAERMKSDREALDFNDLYEASLPELRERAEKAGLSIDGSPSRIRILNEFLSGAAEEGRALRIRGSVEITDDGFGFLVYTSDNYRPKSLSGFIPECLIDKLGLDRGHEVEVLAAPPGDQESTPLVFEVLTVMGNSPEVLAEVVPFTELVPYYPTARILLEQPEEDPKWHNLSMRIVDLVSPIGFGQRGLIVAPPRTGKTVILQNLAHSVRVNSPETHLIILLVDERPEEVTDFRRHVEAEIISSTFDEAAESHVHAAEMVIERARRMVEAGRHVVILLDSITRLARAYNTTMPNSGKILSGGVEANALQKPKRFFGSARNIEGGGSLTIMGTALVDTGSKMDEVIFEEFKGTGNMELHLDRELSNKRVFPALSMERSGTRKEELLYHPDEMSKVHSLRRAMKGIPSADAMELLIQKAKKCRNNAEFLMTLR